MFGYTGTLGDSDDPDDDPNSTRLLEASWEDLSIMDRLGITSCDEMCEEEVEGAITQFALGFHCDQYTLTQRLQAERHERSVAEENLQRELREAREMLTMLHERLPAMESREMIHQMDASLQTLESSMEHVMKSAELLGAAHQEARLSHAVELMCVHLQHLKKRHLEESEEMLEVRKQLHRRKRRLHSDSTDDRERFRYSSQQPTRRRVSITLLPTQSEMKRLETLFQDSCQISFEKTDTRQEVAPSDSPVNSLNQDEEESSVFLSSTPVSPLHRRQRCSPIQLKGSSLEGEGLAREEEPNCERCSTTEQRPLLSWGTWRQGMTYISLVIVLILALLCLFMSVSVILLEMFLT